MNIIVLVFDTLRYDHIGAHGNTWIKTPNLDRFAAEALVFDRSFAASFPTIPHRTDAMTGTHGGPFRPWRPLRHDLLTLPRYLGENGFCTQLIHDTPHLVNGGHNFDWPFHAWTQIRGAEVDRPWIDDKGLDLSNFAVDPLFDGIRESVGNPGYWKTYTSANRSRTRHEDWNAARLFLTAAGWLKENSTRDNFFLWIDCFDPHEPWDVPPEYAVLYDKGQDWDGRIDPRMHWGRNDPGLPQAAKDRIRALYAAKVTWADRWFGELLEALDRTGLARNTTVIITSDHGTNVGEWGKFGKGYPVHEQEGHVPFMVRMPGGTAGRSKVFVQPQDLFATVCGIAGSAVPPGLDSHDVVSEVISGKENRRPFALSGRALDEGSLRGQAPLFTLFAGEWYLVGGRRVDDSSLIRYGETENRAVENRSTVEKLHAAGRTELGRRGMDPKLLEWMDGGSEGAPKGDCMLWDGYPGPAGFTPYFKGLYEGS